MALVDRLATLAVLEELTLPFEGTRLIGHIVPDGLTLYLKRTMMNVVFITAQVTSVTAHSSPNMDGPGGHCISPGPHLL